VPVSGQQLPAFEDPPVIETLLGVQFAPLERFSLMHFGIFWASVREMYPRYQILPALDPAVENFDPQLQETQKRVLELRVKQIPEPVMRCWLMSASSDQLIQLQRDRFIRNWRKMAAGEVYPRYDRLRPNFEFDWNRFLAFLRDNDLGNPEINQCEVTYVNHIEIGKAWASFAETPKIVSLLAREVPTEFLPRPEFFEMTTSYPLSDYRGRLRVSVQPVFSQPLNKEVLQLTLTARGKPASSHLGDILEWFDLGHEWIVRGFAELTTPELHKIWRRTS
jgi:uncharacterized protein (TIGR04255 family)